jgi:rhamnosyltransferase
VAPRLKRILAVVVSYNGQSDTVDTVAALLGQVDHVHVVDNASAEASWNHLQALRGTPTVSIERLHRNAGIGHALNLGLAKARQMGFGWLLTMDQDSLVDSSMLAAFRNFIDRDAEAACLTPNVFTNGRSRTFPDGPVDFAITSGNLVKLDVFSRVGAYDEGLFIDGVDIDFSLRVRAAGYSICRVGAAVLHHQLGSKHVAKGPLARFYLAHSPLRRYYMYRNHLYLMQRYWHRFPLFIAKATLVQALHLLALLVHERNTGASLRLIARGIRDFFRGRTGPEATPA